MEIIAERKLKAIKPNGDVIETFVRIGKPYIKEGMWKCFNSIDLIDDVPPEMLVVSGLDSWDAVQSGMRFIFLRLKNMEKKGWVFKWFNDTEEGSDILLPYMG